MTTTPNPLLVTKMTRIALQILSTAEPRSKVTSPAAELILESISLASPKLRRELLDDHLAALDWILKDAFTSQVPKATFTIETVPRDLTDDKLLSPALPEGVTGMDIARAAAALLTQNHKLWTLAQMQQGELSNAWDHGYLCGAADQGADPVDNTYVGISNPYTLEKGESTP